MIKTLLSNPVTSIFYLNEDLRQHSHEWACVRWDWGGADSSYLVRKGLPSSRDCCCFLYWRPKNVLILLPAMESPWITKLQPKQAATYSVWTLNLTSSRCPGQNLFCCLYVHIYISTIYALSQQYPLFLYTIANSIFLKHSSILVLSYHYTNHRKSFKHCWLLKAPCDFSCFLIEIYCPTEYYPIT